MAKLAGTAHAYEYEIYFRDQVTMRAHIHFHVHTVYNHTESRPATIILRFEHLH